MGTPIVRLIKKYRSNYEIPNEQKMEYENKNLRVLRWAMLFFCGFGIINFFVVYFLRRNTMSPEKFPIAITYYLMFIVLCGISSILCFIFYRKQVSVIKKHIAIHFSFVGMFAISSYLIMNTDYENITTILIFICIESIITIAFFYINAVFFSSLITIIIGLLITKSGLVNNSSFALNCAMMGITIVMMNFTKMRLAVRNIKLTNKLQDQSYTLKEQTIELQAQQNELLKFKSMLEERVDIQALEIQDKNEKLIQIQKHIIMSLSALVENRDKDTGMHVQRTSAYVKLLAEETRKAGFYTDILTDEYINILEKAAPMHDIGKIVVSDTILKKPGRLTDSEFSEMQRHSTEGGKIIQDVLGGAESPEYVQVATEITQAHHEKWNGKGYPYGLKAEEIPLSARFMALADVFDALVSERCYKEAMSVDEAFVIIKDGLGQHFDPDLTGVFLSIKDQLLEIRNKYKD